METEQYTAEWSVGHQRNNGESQKLPRIKWKWKHNLPGPEGHSKGKFIDMSTLKKVREINKWPNDVPQALRKTRTSQTPN
jgi:hypothetical protein